MKYHERYPVNRGGNAGNVGIVDFPGRLVALFLSFALMLAPINGSAQIGGDPVTALMTSAVADVVAAQSAAGNANSRAGHGTRPTDLAGDVQAAGEKMLEAAAKMDEVVGQYTTDIAAENERLYDLNRRISEAQQGGSDASDLISQRADAIAEIELLEDGLSSWATAAATWRIVGGGWLAGAGTLSAAKDEPSTAAGQPSNGGATSGITGAALGISMSAWSIGTPPTPASP